MATKQPHPPAASVSDAALNSSADKPSVTIDFHSAEFNRTDDLNDWSGNYLSFESLGDIVTADMRHQMERRHHGEAVESPAVKAAPLEIEKTDWARHEAETVDAAPPITIVSRGRTLIIDTDAGRAIGCGKALSEKQLDCTLIVTKRTPAGSPLPRFNRSKPPEVEGVSVTGAFGGFFATVTVKGQQKPLKDCLGEETSPFDLVLDLQPAPSFAGACPPLGYYAPGLNPVALEEAMAEMPQMRGQFRKPQFNIFQKTFCLHGRSRTRNCRRCIDICPFGAIQSIDHKISIDHYLCQGCGACALACPAEAIRMNEKPQQELLNRLHSLLENRLAEAVLPPSLVVSDVETAVRDEPPEVGERNGGHTVHLETEQISYVGLEMVLTALAYGYASVLVACGHQNPPGIKKAVEWQVQMARAILLGLGLFEDRCRFTLISPDGAPDADLNAAWPEKRANNLPMAKAAFSNGYDRRTLLRLVVQYLYNQSGSHQPRLPLPAGAPFGGVSVGTTCTLCMACAGACPTGALSTGADRPRLLFRESKCLQCGFCEEACPEKAINLQPSLLCDPAAVEAPLVLREEEPFRCVECGVPFASLAIINHMKEKLMGHWMYSNERQLRRLQMCGTCRTRDAFISQDVKLWNQR